MGTNEETRGLIGEFFAGLGNGDADAVSELFADEIDWWVPGNDALPWTGQRTAQFEVAEYLKTMWPHFEPRKSTVTVNTILVDGDDAAVFLDFSHTVASTGRSFATPTAMRFTVSQGKIVRMHLYEDTEAVSSAFFS